MEEKGIHSPCLPQAVLKWDQGHGEHIHPDWHKRSKRVSHAKLSLTYLRQKQSNSLTWSKLTWRRCPFHGREGEKGIDAGYRLDRRGLRKKHAASGLLERSGLDRDQEVQITGHARTGMAGEVGT